MGHLIEAVQLVEPVGDGLAVPAHGQLEGVVHEVVLVIAAYRRRILHCPTVQGAST